MLRSAELEPIVHDRVFREGGESVVRPLDIVEEDSTVLVLHDRLEFLLRGFLLDPFDGEILFARDVVLILHVVDSVDIVVSSPTPAPVLFPGQMFNLVPPAAPTPALLPTANTATFGTTEAMELIQSVGRNASMKHDVIPGILGPLRRLQARGIDEGGSAGPLVRELPGAGDRRVAARW